MKPSVLGAITEYIMRCPALAGGTVRVAALGPRPVEFAVETSIFDPVLETYIDGSSDRVYQFSISSRQPYSIDRLQNLANSGLYEEIAAWLDSQNAAGIFPLMPPGCHPEEIRATSSGYMYDTDQRTARYQIVADLTYHQDAPQRPGEGV